MFAGHRKVVWVSKRMARGNSREGAAPIKSTSIESPGEPCRSVDLKGTRKRRQQSGRWKYRCAGRE